MNKLPHLLAAFLGLMFIAFNACSNTEAKPLNPNGDSELALVMRSMHEDGLKAKEQLLKGEKPELNYECSKLYTAKATEPEKVASPIYEGYAKSFEDAVKTFDQEYNADKTGTYQNMVDACMNCHREVCPGPMVKIKRMYLTEKEIASLTEQ